MSGYILLNRVVTQGTENIYGLLQAVKKEVFVEFEYQKYFEHVPTQRRTAPYALKEFDMSIHDVAGTSIRAFVAAFYAFDKTWEEIEEIPLKLK